MAELREGVDPFDPRLLTLKLGPYGERVCLALSRIGAHEDPAGVHVWVEIAEAGPESGKHVRVPLASVPPAELAAAEAAPHILDVLADKRASR